MEPVSKLEAQILACVSEYNGWILNDDIEFIEVLSRDNTGAGRFVYFRSNIRQDKLPVPDGVYSAGDKYIKCEELEYGLGFSVTIEKGAAVMIEIATYGNYSWDGDENKCSIVN